MFITPNSRQGHVSKDISSQRDVLDIVHRYLLDSLNYSPSVEKHVTHLSIKVDQTCFVLLSEIAPSGRSWGLL
jgi:hypothetical protein